MSPEAMQGLIKRLARDLQFEMIFVLLMVHRERPCLQGLFEISFMNSVAGKWNQGRAMQFLNEVTNLLE